MTDLAANMSQLKARWMIGGTALEAAPAPWRAALEGDPNPELALFALAGQMSQTALTPAPSAKLTALPALPRLPLPTLPDANRAQFRRVLLSRSAAEDMAQILHLLAARGWSVHPADFMPKSFLDLPPAYAPWADWTEARPEHAEEDLTAENWDLWYPAERRTKLIDMRELAPDAARDLIAEKAGELPADQRLRVVETLERRLSDADAPYLTSLETDRSGKVKDLARRYLARLGQAGDDPEIAQEYAGFFTLGKAGLLRRAQKITANPLKTKAQGARRLACAQKVSLHGFAAALGLSQTDLITAWDAGAEATDELVTLVAATGSDAAVAALAARMGDINILTPNQLAPLADRLDRDARLAALKQALKSGDAFRNVRAWGIGSFGTIRADELLDTHAMKTLLKAITADQSADRHRADWQIVEPLFSLGLLADQPAALAVLDAVKSAGMFGADPALQLLSLNAALSPRTN